MCSARRLAKAIIKAGPENRFSAALFSNPSRQELTNCSKRWTRRAADIFIRHPSQCIRGSSILAHAWHSQAAQAAHDQRWLKGASTRGCADRIEIAAGRYSYKQKRGGSKEPPFFFSFINFVASGSGSWALFGRVAVILFYNSLPRY